MASDPSTLKVSPSSITQITAIKRNGVPIIPITYTSSGSGSGGGSLSPKAGNDYTTFLIDDFLSGDNVTFSSEGYRNLDVIIGTTDVVTFTEGFQTIAFYKHAGTTYEIEDEQARTDILTKQDTLVSGTNIKTINNNSILGSGNIDIDSLPTQTGNSGKFLTTNGSTTSWATIDALPSQSGNNGKFLTTNGTTASWGNATSVKFRDWSD